MAEDPDEEIMGATYRALCRHGFAALTMQDIADESARSKAALHYHYDTKHDLLVAFLEYLYQRFEARLREVDDDEPVAWLYGLVDALLDPPERADAREFRTAMLELRAQAPYDRAYRDRLANFDALARELVREAVAAGVESGAFRADVDPAETATFVVTVASGAITRRVTLDCPDPPVEAARRAIHAHVASHLLADDGEVHAG